MRGTPCQEKIEKSESAASHCCRPLVITWKDATLPERRRPREGVACRYNPVGCLPSTFLTRNVPIESDAFQLQGAPTNW